MIPACSDSEEEDPVVRGAPSRGLHLCLLPRRRGRGEQCGRQCLPSPVRAEKMLLNNQYLLLLPQLLSAAFCNCLALSLSRAAFPSATASLRGVIPQRRRRLQDSFVCSHPAELPHRHRECADMFMDSLIASNGFLWFFVCLL